MMVRFLFFIYIFCIDVMSDNRAYGALMEQVVCADYSARWYQHLESNMTIKGWEIDLIFRQHTMYVFVEVKSVDFMDELFDYITVAKKKALHKAIQSYLRKHVIDSDYRLDVVFVRNGKIIERYEDESLE